MTWPAWWRKAEAVVRKGCPAARISEDYRHLYGEQHPWVAQCLDDLGRALPPGEEKRKAIEEALAMRRRLFGETHIDVARSLSALAVLDGDENKLG